MTTDALGVFSTANIFFKIFISLLGGAIVLILFCIKCTEKTAKCKRYELANITINDFARGDDLKRCVLEINNKIRKYDRRNANITYTYWSYVGMIFSSGYALVCQYLSLNGSYIQMAVPALVLSGIFFGINFATVAWRAITHSRGLNSETEQE